jgi:hypothetical protein
MIDNSGKLGDLLQRPTGKGFTDVSDCGCGDKSSKPISTRQDQIATLSNISGYYGTGFGPSNNIVDTMGSDSGGCFVDTAEPLPNGGWSNVYWSYVQGTGPGCQWA